jgi:hypothetical protein
MTVSNPVEDMDIGSEGQRKFFITINIHTELFFIKIVSEVAYSFHIHNLISL